MHEADKKIGFFAALVIAINAMIGAGVLAMPAVFARQAGPASIFSFIISIFAVLCIGLSLGRTAELFPGDNWNYRYPARWAGHMVGIISSLLYTFGVIVAMGLLVQQAGVWLQLWMPATSSFSLSFGLMIMLTLLVIAGTQISSWGQYVIAFFVVVPLLLTSLVCWSHFNPELLTPFMPAGINSILGALPHALFGLLGFESIASLYSVVRNPSKTVPRVFITAILIVGGMYLLFVGSMIFSIPRSLFQDTYTASLAEVLHTVFPEYKMLASLVTFSAIFAIVGTLHSMIWSISVLLSDLMTKVRSPLIRKIFIEKVSNRQVQSVLFASGSIMLVSFITPPHWLMPLTAVLIVPSYILSIIPLFMINAEWESRRNIVTVCAFLSSCLILYYALQVTWLSM
jgi:amino acid transporter